MGEDFVNRCQIEGQPTSGALELPGCWLGRDAGNQVGKAAGKLMVFRQPNRRRALYGIRSWRGILYPAIIEVLI